MRIADVNGDGKGDFIAVDKDTTYALPSTGSGFGQPEDWTSGPVVGELGMYFADVTGDGTEDYIAVDRDSTTCFHPTELDLRRRKIGQVARSWANWGCFLPMSPGMVKQISSPSIKPLCMCCPQNEDLNKSAGKFRGSLFSTRWVLPPDQPSF